MAGCNSLGYVSRSARSGISPVDAALAEPADTGAGTSSVPAGLTGEARIPMLKIVEVIFEQKIGIARLADDEISA
jgi:hypothetical protein